MSNFLALDCETHLIRPGVLAPKIVCGSWATDLASGILTPEEFLSRIEAWLEEPGLNLVGANISYDFGCILAAKPELLPKVWAAYEAGRIFDVLIAATLNAIADGRLHEGELFRPNGDKVMAGRYSLQEVVREFLGREDAKKNDEYRLRYAELDDTPIPEWPEAARQYPVDDAANTLDVALMQMTNCRNLQDLPRQAHAALCTHLGAMWGLRTDPAAVEQVYKEVEGHLKKLKAEALGQGFLKVGGTKKEPKLTKDTKALKERVFAAYDGMPPKTPTGETSISREALQDSGDPALEAFAEVGKWEKVQTYLPTLTEASRTPLNVKCNILLATGRASYDGLIQLLPRKGGVRECFTARPGTVWSSVDYAAIEMSTLAQVCLWTVKHSKLADAINNGQDVHSLFAAHMIGVPYEDFLANKKLPEYSEKRQAAKAANFGFPGMMGPAKFVIAKRREGSSVCSWTHKDGLCGAEKVHSYKDQPLDGPLCARCIEEAEKLREHYVTVWPEIRSYWRWVQAELQAGDAVTQFVSGRVRGNLRPAQAANTLFQGLAADGAKRAVVNLTREMYLDRESPLYGSRLMVFSHDEVLLEIPEERLHEAAHRQAEIMVSSMREFVPDVLVKAEPAAMRNWTKSAEPVYVEGRLVPWEPKS